MLQPSAQRSPSYRNWFACGFVRAPRDISLGMFLLLSLGLLLWMIYEILIGARPVMVANAATLALSLTILGLKLHYDRTG